MLKRIITGVIAAGLLALVCIFANGVVFSVAFGLLALLGVYEMLGCIGARRNFTIALCMYTMTILSVILVHTVSSHSLYITAFAGILFCVLLILFASAVFSEGRVPVDKVCIAFTTCAYVLTGFISIILLRDMKMGKYIYLLAFIGPWISDTFAYFTGMLLGKHKLIPSVSPKKTIEGSLGGILFCIIGCIVYGYAVKSISGGAAEFHVAFLALLGLVISIVSQVGDLIFSLIKRRYDIKDYGFIFPGHGGVLDRFDSVIATAPLILIACESLVKMNLM
ncbi:MAG: phosphatidate cytidylyltransferase [Clostridiales bacterium]|jgi:phosphatidate cytidylyltransferase|nr:phosphatidate cytidylyltransferase [Clostridiales bacterium]